MLPVLRAQQEALQELLQTQQDCWLTPQDFGERLGIAKASRWTDPFAALHFANATDPAIPHALADLDLTDLRT